MSGFTKSGRSDARWIGSLRARDGPNLLTIDHPKGAAQGLFTSALPSEADIKLILAKEAANDPKRSLLCMCRSR